MKETASEPILIVVAAVVVRDGRVLLTRRGSGTHLEGMWELPGGKVEPGEDLPAALARELAEELGIDASPGEPFAFNYHVYPGKRVLLLTYLTEFTGTPRNLGCADLGWFAWSGLERLETPPADIPIFERLRPLLRPE